MTEAAPAVPAAALPGPAKRGRRAAGAPKASGPSVTELLTQAVSASKERGGVSLAALKKSLAASGYDVERNNSRIKLGLKGLVSRGTLLQTKGTGASGSFKLNKQQAGAREKAAQRKAPPAAAKGRKPAAAAAKGAKKPAKAPKRLAPAAGAKKAVKGPKKPKAAAAAKAKKAAKSPAKAKAKPKPPKAKVAKPKKPAKAPKK